MSANSDYFWDSVFGGLLSKIPEEENIHVSKFRLFLGQCVWLSFGKLLLRRSEFISANSDYFWDSVFGGLLAKFS